MVCQKRGYFKVCFIFKNRLKALSWLRFREVSRRTSLSIKLRYYSSLWSQGFSEEQKTESNVLQLNIDLQSTFQCLSQLDSKTRFTIFTRRGLCLLFFLGESLFIRKQLAYPVPKMAIYRNACETKTTEERQKRSYVF